MIPASLLFQFQLDVPRIDALPRTKGRLLQLPESATLFVPAGLNDPSEHLRLRLAWNDEGLAVEILVSGKQLPPAGRRRDLRASDHIQLFFDTRHTANVHRATEFCSALIVLPVDEDQDDEPSAAFIEIAQQRTSKREQSGRKCRTHVDLLADGYRLELWIPASQLSGFAEAPGIGHLGFYLVVEDTELGQLPLSVGGDFPVSYDPSTWLQVRLVPS